MSEVFAMWDEIIAAESCGDCKRANKLYKKLNRKSNNRRK